ncbi:MAG TPA: hypothetical protein VD993_00205 [Chitinophagaceae bacterium]|nr:hypothetical protein [Chitinophagaceae bacterium]
MKRTIIVLLFFLAAFRGWTQNIDSLLAEPQVIELTISSPQPRLNESFQIAIDMNHLRANIFKSLVGKVRLAENLQGREDGQLTMSVNALGKGKQTIGPLEFYLNKTKYTTNKVVYEVIDALPNTDIGLWFRKVMTSDSTFCIIIEQRIPAKAVTSHPTESSVSISTEAAHTNIVKFKDSYSIEGVSGSNSNVTTNYSGLVINGQQKEFLYAYSVYYFHIADRSASIKITKDKFDHLPKNYKFEDIIIQ